MKWPATTYQIGRKASCSSDQWSLCRFNWEIRHVQKWDFQLYRVLTCETFEFKFYSGFCDWPSFKKIYWSPHKPGSFNILMILPNWQFIGSLFLIVTFPLYTLLTTTDARSASPENNQTPSPPPKKNHPPLFPPPLAINNEWFFIKFQWRFQWLDLTSSQSYFDNL